MSKPKVKISVECPHCGQTIVHETNDYHKVIHGDYFKKDDVIPFELLKEKVKNEEWPYGILHDTFGWSRHFQCDHCNKYVAVVLTDDTYKSRPEDETWRFEVKKAGKRLDPKLINRLFEKLGRFSRGIPIDAKVNAHVKCQKEVFIERVWEALNKDIVKVPWVIKTEKYKGIVYIARMDYTLGYGEAITLHCFDVCGSLMTLSLSIIDLYTLEYLPFENETAQKVYTAIFSM